MLGKKTTPFMKPNGMLFPLVQPNLDHFLNQMKIFRRVRKIAKSDY